MGKRDPKGPLGHRIARSANPGQAMTRQGKQLVMVESSCPQFPAGQGVKKMRLIAP
jgi:hypothetical protein